MKIKIDKAINPKGEHNGYIVRVKGASYYGKDIAAVVHTVQQILCSWEHFGVISPDFIGEDLFEQLAKGDL